MPHASVYHMHYTCTIRGKPVAKLVLSSPHVSPSSHPPANFLLTRKPADVGAEVKLLEFSHIVQNPDTVERQPPSFMLVT